MCIEQYLTRFAPHRSERQNTIALISLLFHDTGKPEAEETLEKKDGSGTYRRYAGHEQLSAVAFTEHWLQDPDLQALLPVEDARAVRFIIEHHLPYGLKDATKRSALRTAFEHVLREDVETFYDCLRSDAAGRISDDHETKLKNVEEWITEFQTVPLTVTKRDPWAGTCYIMVGPSGSGKSTWIKQMIGDKKHGWHIASMDRYRHDFWFTKNNIGFSEVDDKEFYRTIFQYAVDNESAFKAFMSEKINETFRSVAGTAKLHAPSLVFVDNTNGSKKARARWVQEARNCGLKVVAVEFWNTLHTVLDRQETRTDKEVPGPSVCSQYYAQTCTLLGSEVDEVIVVTPT
jgi:predicted kinase